MTSSYLTDLLDQPKALQATLDSLSEAQPVDEFCTRLAAGKYRRIILTGMGSSYHGLYPLQLRLFTLPLGVIRLETAELIHYARELIHPENLIIAASQSGESVEVVKLLELTHHRVDLIGITNTAGSSLAEGASRVVLTCAGEEATVSCKTYISALAALTWLGDQLVGGPLQFPSLADLPERISEYWKTWWVSVDLLSQQLRGVQNLYLLGRGPSLAAVLAGALIIKEASRFGAEGMNSAAFRHGPLEVVTPQTHAFVYVGDGTSAAMNNRIAIDILAAGGKAEIIDSGSCVPPFHLPDCQPPALPIMEIMVAQMASLALAQLQGHEAGQFKLASKVTVVE
jgi:glutamine---fructose-6-phosphate transaminase (isomerizing)